MNVVVSNEFDKHPVSDSLKEYVDTLCYTYALAGIVNYKLRHEPYYEAEIDWMFNDEEGGLTYVVQLWYGCDNFTVHETVSIVKSGGGYITITDSEDHNTTSHP